MKYLSTLLLAFVVFVGADTAAAQQVGERVRIELRNGGVVVGTVQEADDDTIILLDENGVTLTVQRADMAGYRDLSGTRFNQIDPTDSRLFFSPTGRSMQQGRIRFTAYQIFFPSFAFGVTDWLDASVGVTILPGSPIQILSLNTKATPLRSERMNVAVGMNANTLIGDTEDVDGAFVGSFYTVGTFGSSTGAVTGGVFLPYGASITEGECVGLSEGVTMMLGGEKQLTSSIKLVSENYLVPSEGIGAVSLGFRFIGDRLAGEFAGFVPVAEDVDGVFVLPWISISYNFR